MGASVAVMTACSGFLIAVLWMDLMFDVQVVGKLRVEEASEPVLASIAGYYRRATTTSRPMGHLIAVVMAVLLVTLALRVGGGSDPIWLSAVSVTLSAVPIVLALSRTVPNAIRLGERAGTAAVQTRRARSVLVDHVVCLAAQVAFLTVWLVVICLATP